MIIFLCYVIFTAIGIWWFLNRIADKHGSDKRWFIKPLDTILIVPLLPYAVLFGWLMYRRKK